MMLAKSLRTAKERTLYKIALVFSLLCWALVLVSIIGAFYGLIIAAGVAVAHALWLAHVRGNGVRIDVDQLPQLAARIRRASAALGLEQTPEAYVLQAGGVLNALATRLLSRRFIIIYSDLIDACEAVTPSLDREDPPPSCLDFIIAHELGHLACGHLSWLLLPARLVPLLGPAYSRACEYTCDACGQAVVGELSTSGRALAILAGGAAVGRRLELSAFAEQRADTTSFWTAVYELNASHPYLAKRVAALQEREQPGAAPALPRSRWAYPLAPFFACASGGAPAGAMMALFVIGVLAAVAIPSFTKYVSQARAMQAQSVVPEARGELTPPPAVAQAAGDGKTVSGERFHWTMDLPAGWQRLPGELVRQQNPLADGWIRQAQRDAHVMVVAEQAPQLSLAALEQHVLGNLKTNLQAFQQLGRSEWQPRAGKGILLQLQGEAQGLPLTYLYGLLIDGGRAFQVVAFAQTSSFGGLRDEFLQVMSSFQPLTSQASAR